jgi:hypothetical protein
MGGLAGRAPFLVDRFPQSLIGTGQLGLGLLFYEWAARLIPLSQTGTFELAGQKPDLVR